MPALRVVHVLFFAAFAAHGLLLQRDPRPGNETSGAAALHLIHADLVCWSKAERPITTMLSVVAGLPPAYVQTLRENRALEADEFGYEYCEFSHALDETRDIAWSKIRAMQELWAQGRTNLVWMDADAWFTHLRSFESITQPHFDAGKDLVLTDDASKEGEVVTGGPINSGVFEVRKSPWSEAFWKSIYDDFPEALEPGCWPTGCYEQRAICKYRDERREDFEAHVEIIPHHLMNAIAEFDGEFIAHIAGGHKNQNMVKKYDWLGQFVEKGSLQIAAEAKVAKRRRASGGFFDPERVTARFEVVF